MKTSRIIASLTGLAWLALSASTQAQYKPTGDDGITASPRLRQQLDDRRRSHSPAPAAANITKMSCPKCTDQAKARVDSSVRGANKPATLVVTHECSGCDTTIKTAGFGKETTNVVTHECSNCGSANLTCCNPDNDSEVTTPGME